MKPQNPEIIKIVDKPHMEARIDQLPPLSSAPDYVSKPTSPLDDNGAAEARRQSREAARSRTESLPLRRKLAVLAFTALAAVGIHYAPQVLSAPNHEVPGSANYTPNPDQLGAMDPQSGANLSTPPVEGQSIGDQAPTTPDHHVLNDGQDGPQE